MSALFPSDENITEVATARLKAIRAKAVELGDTESSDERLLDIVIRRAQRHAGNAKTAQAAVQWAITDMYAPLQVVKDIP